MTRAAFIDIGSGTLLLLIVERDPARPRGGLRTVVDLCRFGRLGQGLDATGQLADEAIARSLDYCREFRGVLDAHHVSHVEIIATQAVREASNAAAFVEPAQAILGAPVQTIAGEREAMLAFGAVAATFPDLHGKPYLVVDVGGASTELVVTDGVGIRSAVSLPIGAVKLSERHLQSDPPTAAQRTALDADIDDALARLLLPIGVPLIATAGTATTLAAVALGLQTYDPERINGLSLAPAELAALVERVATATVAERIAMPGMVAARADVIAGGAAIFARLVQRIDASAWIACDRGIRWGLAFEHAAATPLDNQ